MAGQDLREIGLTKARARTVAALTEAFLAEGDFIHPALDHGETRERLLAIPGIGPWTADYIALRALRDPDAFPAADLGLLKASAADSAAALETRAEAWRPWRGYAALYLWNSLT
jgi:3-methyladenine DNA glycosylase/8-oxoguanine DNA glycosylase